MVPTILGRATAAADSRQALSIENTIIACIVFAVVLNVADAGIERLVLGHLGVRAQVHKCVLPADNIFGPTVNPGPHECVADGYWALLPPLSAGSHTIRFAGAINSVGFSLQVTYYITVSPP
jgi:hypothetical protein